MDGLAAIKLLGGLSGRHAFAQDFRYVGLAHAHLYSVVVFHFRFVTTQHQHDRDHGGKNFDGLITR